MNREAKEWADLFRGKKYSDDVIAGVGGMNANGGAGPVKGSSQIFVTVALGLKRVLGDRREVCEEHLRLFAARFHGAVPVDANGNDMKTKLMRWRLGPAGVTDDPAATQAALS
jgi:hypothetical protein